MTAFILILIGLTAIYVSITGKAGDFWIALLAGQAPSGGSSSPSTTGSGGPQAGGTGDPRSMRI